MRIPGLAAFFAALVILVSNVIEVHAAGALATGRCGAFGYSIDDASPAAAGLRARSARDATARWSRVSAAPARPSRSISIMRAVRTPGRAPTILRARKTSPASNAIARAGAPA